MKPLIKISGIAHLHFMSVRKLCFAISILAIITSIALVFTRSLNFGIDFTGGIIIELRSNPPIAVSEMRDVMKKTGIEDIGLQEFGSENDILIRIGAGSSDTSEARSAIIDQVKNAILEEFKTAQIDYRKVDFVGPQVGDELIEAGLLSLILAVSAILLYIWMRFEWHFGLGAVIALIHDSILTIGLYSLLGIEFNLTSVAAILTIIGYSINDSVVIYDRIRENLRKYKKKSISDIIDLSLNETLSRTILTAGTTAIALLALVILGGEVLYGFSIAILFGVIIGTYSSIYIAAPILLMLGYSREGEEENK